MQDAFNLAWKVAQVIRWDSSEALLDTYHPERHPVARRVLEASSFAIKMVGITTNPIARKVQSAAMSLVGSLELAQSKIRAALSEVDIHYNDGPLCSYKGSKTLTPGDRIPEVIWRDYAHRHHRLYDLFTGFHWTLISRDKGADLPDIDASRLRQVVITRLGESVENRFSDPAQAVAEACGLEPGGHILVRPDGYLAGCFVPGDEKAIRGYWNRHCEAAAAASA
jgi:NADPH-dependent dioxygenase